MDLVGYPELIIFDWDGTLVGTFDLLCAAHNHVRRNMGLVPWTTEEVRRFIRASAREIYPEIYGDDCDDALALLYAYVEHNHIEMLAKMPSADDTLAYLRNDRRIPLAVISNKKQYYLEHEVAWLGWQNHFQSVVGAGTAVKDKPSSAPVDYLLAKLGIVISDKRNVWLIGDTETDIICAHNAHITSVFIRNGFGGDDIIEDFKPKAVINDCKNLHDMLQQEVKCVCNRQ